MFPLKHGHSEHVDLSSDLVDARDFNAGHLKTLDYLQDVKVLAYEPLSGLLAIGTSTGVVWILGAPGVQASIKVSDHPLKFIEFASFVSKLLCIDETNRLYVWDLSQTRHPLRQASTRFNEPINCVTLSPSHSHAFLVLQSGKIKTYDLLCLRISPYVMPNLWLEYEKKFVASGTLTPLDPGSEIPISLTIHPRNLNLVFVCYGGAVILADLKGRTTLRTYEYILPAGAPGPTGYSGPDVLKHRRPAVTTLAVHPAGHFFATGHTDGSIVFWAIADEDKPLLVRTLKDVDINIVDGEKLSDFLDKDNAASVQSTPFQPLEPILKLSWSGYPNSSDPRGGSTTLTILGGGLGGGDEQGVTTLLLPPFNPANNADTKATSDLSPFMRAAMRESILQSDLYTYTISGAVHDYLLLPHENPHFANAFDPAAIIILSEGSGGGRSTGTYEFPPPVFELRPHARDVSGPTPSDTDLISQDLASTLESMRIADEPHRLALPTLLWNGSSSLTGGYIVKLEGDSYKSLLRPSEKFQERDYGLRGGAAWVDDVEDESRHAKFQPHRILITWHRDLTIHFQDISVQLLVSSDSSPMSTAYPHPLPSLTIDLVTTLSDSFVLPRCSPEALQEGSIDYVSISPESLECTVILKSGDIFIYKFETDAIASSNVSDKELVSLEHIPNLPNLRYRPYLMIPSDRGPVVAFASSDIGFIAVAHNDGSLFIIDMRGPRVILRELQSQPRNRHSFMKHSEDHVDPVKSLVWGIFKLESDSTLNVRLLATRMSGYGAVYTLIRDTLGTFSAAVPLAPLEGVANPLSMGSFVLECKTGIRCVADKARFASALQNLASENCHDVFWISVSIKEVKCTLNVDGKHLARADWSSKAGQVESVQIVQRHNACVLVGFTNKKEMLVHSIPYLEPMHTLSIPRLSSGPLSIDDTGDYIEWVSGRKGVQEGHLGTLFSLRRKSIYKNKVMNLMVNKKTLPSQPQPISMGPASLLNQMVSYVGGQFTTGEQIDTLLGGPDRPLPQKDTATILDRAGSPASAGSGGNLQAATAGAGDLYNRLGSALAERGQMLDSLEDTVGSLQQGTSNMLAQAKRLATEQSTKRWFDFGS